MDFQRIGRRAFLQQGIVASAMLVPGRRLLAEAAPEQAANKFCAFIKFIQGYSFDELSARVADAGFDGVEATVRSKGYIEPVDAPARLPKLVEALGKRGLDCTILCTEVLNADDPGTSPLLEVAADLGIRRYRMGFYRYDLTRPIRELLAAVRRQVEGLIELNQKLGLQALYQNHSGAGYVGSAIWDFVGVIEDLSRDEIGLAFDIRHATVEGGRSWPLEYKLAKPRIGAVFVKDFEWQNERDRHVPLGEGRVDRRFFGMLREDRFAGPISIHVEYLEGRGDDENMEALAADLATARKWLEG